MWIMGQYVLSAVSTAVEHCLAGRKAKSKYMLAPILKDIGSDTDLTQEEKDRREIERMIAQEDLSAKQLRKKGLPETEML